MGAYEEWVKAGKPVSGVARPIKMIGGRLALYGYTVYYIGNDDHMQHIPPEDHTTFSATGWPVSSPRWWIFAMDVMPPPAGSGLPSLQQLGAQMLADAKAGHPGMKWLKYQNWEPERNNGGACYQERFMPNYERRTSTDRGHIHDSARSDCKDWTDSDNYDPVARVRFGPTTEDGEMRDFFVKHEDGPTVFLANTMTCRTVTGEEFVWLRDVMAGNGFDTTIWLWPLVKDGKPTGADKAKGVLLDSIDDPPQPMSEADLQRLAVEIREGLPNSFTLDQIEEVVDRQLDQQSRGGADAGV